MFDYLAYILAVANIVAAIIGIACAISNSISGQKYRGWMSPSAQLVREILPLTAIVIVFWQYWNETIGGMTATFIIVGVSTLGSLYVVWGDHKYRKASGMPSRWLQLFGSL